ncbi:MAG: DUF5658 family protein [Phycisphaerales bacterium]|nr:hypothetical protein [Planctomycetota bacterium]MCH8507946.1 DUF5658 family protein [Phycisphaerales bacterium]
MPSAAASPPHGLRDALRATLGPLARRPYRVVLLAVLIAAMSAIDLYLTLLYLTHSGMSEGNPIARAMIAYQSPVVLAAWKALTVFLCLGILYLVRHKRSAEIGAWVGAIVLACLMAQWSRYIAFKVEVAPEFHLVAGEIDPAFVRLGRVVP